MTARDSQNSAVHVSVVMPFLNQERFIAESIESVLEQTYECWELLLVDDGSSDGSTEIARGYAERFPDRIRYFEHEGHVNRGASASRNLALAHARGHYIALLDADDVYLPENLERQLEALEQFPDAGMVCAATEYWHSWTGQEKDRHRDFVHELGLAPGEYRPPDLLVSYLGQKVTTPCTCSILVRRSAIESFGAFEGAFRYVYTDQVFYVKQALHAPIVVVDGCWARYRQHRDSSCHRVERTGQATQVRLAFLAWVQQYFREQGVTSPALWRTLHRELRLCRRQVFYERFPWFSRLVSRSRNVGRRAARKMWLIR